MKYIGISILFLIGCAVICELLSLMMDGVFIHQQSIAGKSGAVVFWIILNVIAHVVYNVDKDN